MKKIVETGEPITYVRDMPQTLEQRVECLEREFSELHSQVLGLKHRKKDWRSTVGTLGDDEITREAERLGREYRQQQTYHNWLE